MESIFLKIHKKAIGNYKTILDVGCGTGAFMQLISKNKTWKITGIDIHKRSLDEAKKTKVYKKLIKGDVNIVLENLIKDKEKFDVVFCSQLIEHLPKKQGDKLLNLLEKLAKKRIVICTPNGFLEQPYEHELHRNKFQEHRSGWSIDEFIEKGYKVRGMGLRLAWGEQGLARTKNMIASFVMQGISLFAWPFVYIFPDFSAGLICVKIINK